MAYKLAPGEVAPNKKVGNLRCLMCQKPLRAAQTRWCSVQCNRKGNRAANPYGNKIGRPTKMNAETIKKLEEAFAIGASDGEACFYADISHQTLYTYQEDNPEFLERKNKLKERPVLLARQTVVKSLESNPDMAMKYLERKRRKEFATKQEVDAHVEGQLTIQTVQYQDAGDNDSTDNTA